MFLTPSTLRYKSGSLWRQGRCAPDLHPLTAKESGWGSGSESASVWEIHPIYQVDVCRNKVCRAAGSMTNRSGSRSTSLQRRRKRRTRRWNLSTAKPFEHGAAGVVHRAPASQIFRSHGGVDRGGRSEPLPLRVRRSSSSAQSHLRHVEVRPVSLPATAARRRGRCVLHRARDRSPLGGPPPLVFGPDRGSGSDRYRRRPRAAT